MTSKRQKKRGWLIPDAHLPTQDKCIRVYYPDDPAYKAALLGALWELGKWWNWERDASRRAREVAQRWREALMKIEQCEGGGVDCCDKVIIILNQVSYANYVRIHYEANTLFQTWQETTNITEINNFVTNVYGGESSEPNLCFAVLTLVNSVIEEVIARKENESRDNIVLLAATLTVIAAAALVFAIPASAALAAGLGGALGSIVFTGFNAYTIEQIRNANVTSVVNAVYCALKDSSTGYDAMSLPVTPLSSLAGVELEIYNRIAAAFNAPPSNEKLKFWQSWLNILGESRRIGKEASICACVQTYIRVINFDDLMPDVVTRGTIVAGAGRDGSNSLYTEVINYPTSRTYVAEFSINVPTNARVKKVKLWVRRTGNLNEIRPFVNGVRIGTIAVGSAWAYREFTCDIATAGVATITFSYGAAPSSSWTMWHHFDDIEIEYEA